MIIRFKTNKKIEKIFTILITVNLSFLASDKTRPHPFSIPHIIIKLNYAVEGRKQLNYIQRRNG